MGRVVLLKARRNGNSKNKCKGHSGLKSKKSLIYYGDWRLKSILWIFFSKISPGLKDLLVWKDDKSSKICYHICTDLYTNS